MNLNKWNFYKSKKKTSIVKTYIKKGNGKITINNKELNKINNISIKEKLYQPLNIINYYKFNIKIITYKGGIKSQINAIIIALSNNIANYNNKYKILLKKNKLTKSDNRIVESKKTGYKKARKKPQYSKR